MFKDERIDFELGRIYKNAILYSTLISLAAFISRAKLYGELFDFKRNIDLMIMVCPEVLIITAGMLIMACGIFLLLFKKDERAVFLKSAYYRISFWIFFSVIMISFGIYINFFTMINDVVTRHIESVSESVFYYILYFSALYFAYQFKRKDISFNYSVIFLPFKAYCKKVLLNILKLFVLLIPSFAGGWGLYQHFSVKLQSDIFKFETSSISFIKSYALIYLVLIFAYVLVSVAEKLYYDDSEKGYGKNRGLLMYTITAAAALVARMISRSYALKITISNENYSYTKEYFQKIAGANLVSLMFSVLFTYFALSCVFCFMSFFSNNKTIRIFGLSVTFLKLSSVINSMVFNVIYMFSEDWTDTLEYKMYIGYALNLLLLISVFFFLSALFKENRDNRFALITLILYLIYAAVYIPAILSGFGIIESRIFSAYEYSNIINIIEFTVYLSGILTYITSCKKKGEKNVF